MLKYQGNTKTVLYLLLEEYKWVEKWIPEVEEKTDSTEGLRC